MNTPLLTTMAGLSLACVGIAQSHSSPPGYGQLEGNSNASIGGYPAGRYQYFDADLRGTAMTIKGIAYRYDNLSYDPNSQGQGRTFANVTIDMSLGDRTSATSTFSSNPTSTPTRVFAKSVTWPTQSGKPRNFPADFNLSFPFQNNWNYDGSADICADWTYTGGTLANNATWASTTWSYYYIDGIEPSSYEYVASHSFGYGGANRGCNDRGRSDNYGAVLSSTLYYYSPTYSSTSYANKLIFAETGSYFGPNGLVIGLLGAKSVPGGWSFPGVYCNKAHIDPNYVVAQLLQTADSNGNFSIGLGGTYGIPAPPGISGVEIVAQSAWRDTVNGQTHLSAAAAIVVPPAPPSSQKSVLYHYDTSSKTGFGPQTSNANGVLNYAN